MSFSDPIADLLTRIRNGHHAGKTVVSSPASKARENILNVMLAEGYIRGFKRKEVRKNISALDIELKYVDGEPVIRSVQRVSKPGRRVYMPIDRLPKVLNGLGISILSTSRGVISDAEARRQGIGGEVLCQMY